MKGAGKAELVSNVAGGGARSDICVCMKSLEQQPVGRYPDTGDGVRFNICTILSVPDVGNKGAGALSDKPNIKWENDRGKDVAFAHWIPFFNGERINSYHRSLAEKQSAINRKELQ